jgi:hypothetical protein
MDGGGPAKFIEILVDPQGNRSQSSKAIENAAAQFDEGGEKSIIWSKPAIYVKPMNTLIQIKRHRIRFPDSSFL